MDPARWKRVEEIYLAASERKPEERAAFLSVACAEDGELRRDVQSLLKQSAAEGLLDRVAFQPKVDHRHMPSDAALPAIGQRIAHYEIQEKLGAGGMGAVYRAYDTQLRRPVALKILPPEYASDPDRRSRLLREARAASALNHPNIVSIHEAGSDNGVDFIAMELVEGKSLGKIIPAKGLPLGQVLDYAVQIASGLAKAHEAGVIHRDLKPGNIMLSRDGLVKLLDFGLARRVELEPGYDSTLTIEGQILGTPSYMSPEQARGKPLDVRSDVFSFGSLLYEMATGDRAFEKESHMAALAAVVEQEPRALPSSVPHDLGRIIMRCLRKDPAQRFQHMDDVKVELEELKKESESDRFPSQSAPELRRTLRPLEMTAIASAVLLLAAAVLVWTRPWQAARRPTPSQLRMTFDLGLSADPAISPDGKLLAYASDRSGGGNLAIWVQQTGTGDPIRRTRDKADDEAPHFSPDGATIVFQRAGVGVFAVPALTGPERLIAPGGLEPRFSPDGNTIAYWTGNFTELAITGKIFVIPFGQGLPRQLASEFADARHPIWAPDGLSLLFQGRRAAEANDEWWIAPLDGRPPMNTGILAELRAHGLTPVAGFGDWKGINLLFSATAHDPPGRHIWRIGLDPRSGRPTGPAQQITSGAGDDADPSLALDGRFVFANWVYQNSLWRLALRGTESGQGALERLSNSAAFETQPSISADGKTLAFLSLRSTTNREIRIRDLLTGAESPLTIGTGEKTAPVLSADGSKVAYSVVEGARRPIYIVSAQPGREVSGRPCEDCGEPSDWTADGRRILYSAGWPRSSVYLLDAESGARNRILQHPEYSLDQAHLSPDGRRIAFVGTAGEERRIFVASFHGSAVGDWTAVTDGKALDDKPRWMGDDYLIYYSGRDRFGCLWKQRLDARTNRPVGPVSAVYHFHRLRMSPRTSRRTAFEIAVTRDVLILNLVEITGSIWLAALPEPLQP